MPALLPSARCPHCCAGIVTLIAPVSPPALRGHLRQRSAGVIALIALASMPSFCWHCWCCRVAAVVALVSSPLSHPRCRQHRVGIVTVVALALSLLHWHCCQHCAGVFTSVPLVSTALFVDSTPLLHWRLSHCFAGVVTFVAVVALVLSPSSHLRVASIARASLPAFRWRCPPHCTCFAITITQASSQVFRWH